MKAIETRYKGYRFRSRLEARFAILFDCMGMDWDYEPEGFDLPENGLYLPDFFVRFEADSETAKRWPGAGYWIEVKGGQPTREEVKKCQELHSVTGHKCWIFYNGIGSDSRAKQAESFDKEKIGNDANVPDFANDLLVKGREIIRGQESGELLWSAPIAMCSGDNHVDDFYHALTRARSARFEHGETP